MRFKPGYGAMAAIGLCITDSGPPIIGPRPVAPPGGGFLKECALLYWRLRHPVSGFVPIRWYAGIQADASPCEHDKPRMLLYKVCQCQCVGRRGSHDNVIVSLER